jgi:hypothetical protein
LTSLQVDSLAEFLFTIFQGKEDKLEKLDTADKETVNEVITAIKTQHATEIEQLQLKYLVSCPHNHTNTSLIRLPLTQC